MNNQKEIINQISTYFEKCAFKNDDDEENNFLLIKKNCQNLNLSPELNRLIISFINAFETLKKNNQILYDYIYNPNEKVYQVIKEKIREDIKININNIISDIKKEICQILNFNQDQKEVETKMNPIINIITDYTEEINKKLKFLNDELERIKANPKNEVKIKSLENLISSVSNELNKYKEKYE